MTVARDDLLTVKDLAAEFKVSERTLERWALRESDPLPIFKLGSLRRARRSAIEAWKARQAEACELRAA